MPRPMTRETPNLLNLLRTSKSGAHLSRDSKTPLPLCVLSSTSIKYVVMIIARSPLRITLGGGGTDLPSYYRDHEGFIIAAAIDKFVYLTLHETFVEDIIIKYSQMERVPTADEIEHPIIREALRMLEIRETNLEL